MNASSTTTDVKVNDGIGNKCIPQILQSPHKDFILDIAFDHYGRRIATCSADRTVKIFDLDENGEWTTSIGSGWKAHLSGVTSLSWAHPEFGQLLATSGADGTAMIWEERADSGVIGVGAGGNSIHGLGVGGLMGNPAQAAVTRWTERARMSDTRKPLSCVKFAPKHLGLLLATASADGVVRLYEAAEVMTLNHWVLKNSIEVEPDTTELGVRCLDWCQGRFEPATLVVGDSAGNVNIYRYSKVSRKWGLYLRLDGHTNPRKGVLDVAWSPDVGRSYHLISSCGRDGFLRVHKLKKTIDNAGNYSGLAVEPSQVLDTKDDVWRCSWNVTGTVLASSGDGGVVELWKSNFKGNWKCVSKVKGGAF